jgi:hypothetical protein
MKKNIFIKALSVLALGFGMTSCLLEGDDMNTPPGASSPILEMSYNIDGGNNINTGLQFFSSQALLLNPGDATDTINFAATVQGNFSEDVNVSINVNPAAIADNHANDGLNYALMNDTHYKLLNTTGVIHPGRTPYVEFRVVFYPKNIDFTKSFILPITVTNSAGITVSSNFSTVYFHIIGNPIAGLYKWEFIRIPTADGSGPADTHFTGHQGVFLPIDPTSVHTNTGYYDGGPYIISFDDDGAGNLTNFKAVIDPTAVAAWTAAGIAITQDPTITVTSDLKSFTIHYRVLGGNGPRDVTDIFTK